MMPTLQSEEFAVYSTYAENYMEAMVILEEMLARPDVIQYFRVRRHPVTPSISSW